MKRNNVVIKDTNIRLHLQYKVQVCSALHRQAIITIGYRQKLHTNWFKLLETGLNL